MSRARLHPEGSEVVARDETILWDGRPGVLGLARRVFHLRALLGYFAVLAVWDLASAYQAGFRANAALLGLGWVALAALAVAAVVFACAWIMAVTTRYTLTDKRLILQIGVALPIALTLPLRRIGSADLRLFPDGSGDLPLTLGDGQVAYLLLWPHARPWRFKVSQPMLRSVPDAVEVATVLSRALLAASPSGEAVAVAPVASRGASRPPAVEAAVAA